MDSPIKRTAYPGLDGVLAEMKRLVQQYKGDPKVRQKVYEITGAVPRDIRTGLPNRRDFQAIAEAVYNWMKRNIAYMRDPDGIEWLQTPIKTLELGYGDCDDQSVLAGALLGSAGIPTRFKVVKANPVKPDSYSHVYLEYKANGQWRPFDPTLHTKAGDGLKDSQIFGSRTVSLDDCGCGCGSEAGLAGIPGLKNTKLIGSVLLAGGLAFAYWQLRKQKPA